MTDNTEDLSSLKDWQSCGCFEEEIGGFSAGFKGTLAAGASLAAPPETGQLLLGWKINRRDQLCGGTELINQPTSHKCEG